MNINRKIIKRLTKSDLIKTSFFNGIANFIGICTSIISNKIIAVILGPAGIALIGQFSNFLTMTLSFATMGINNGITKYVAELKEDNDKCKKVLSTAFGLLLLGTVVVSAAVFLGKEYFSRIILHSQKYEPVFIILSSTIILFVLNAFFVSVLNGLKEFKKIVTINILTSILGLAIVIILVTRFGLYGMLVGTIICNTVIFFITAAFIFRLPWVKINNFLLGIDPEIARKLFKFCAMTFTSVFAVVFIQLQVRNYIIVHISLEEAGYWQGIVRICEMYMTFVTATLGIYYLPRLSEIKHKDELFREIKKGYLVLIPLTIFSSTVIFFLKDFIVKILYSASFNAMSGLFLFQLVGNVFKIASWLLAYLMMAKAMAKFFIVSEIIFGLSYYFLTVFFISRYGVVGATYAYALNYLLYLAAMIFIFRDLLLQRKINYAKTTDGIGIDTDL